MEARFTEIERDNRILLEKMTSIMKNGRGNRPNTQQAKTQSPRKSLNNDKRKFSLMRITLENQLILKRLQQAESYYDTSEWETDFKKREKILKVMCEYPYQLSGPKGENSSMMMNVVDANSTMYKSFKGSNTSTIMDQI